MSQNYVDGAGRHEILAAAVVVEEEVWKNHITLFIRSFVVSEKRQRWLNLCLEKPDVRDKSHKMHNDLIRSFCRAMKSEDKESLVQKKGQGIYYEFSGKVWWLSPREAYLVGYGEESIFSIEQGELCVYFWHEMEEYLCQKIKDEPGLKPR